METNLLEGNLKRKNRLVNEVTWEHIVNSENRFGSVWLLLLGHRELDSGIRTRPSQRCQASRPEPAIKLNRPLRTNFKPEGPLTFLLPNRTIHCWKPKQTAGSSDNLTALQMINSDCAQWRRDRRSDSNVWAIQMRISPAFACDSQVVSSDSEPRSIGKFHLVDCDTDHHQKSKRNSKEPFSLAAFRLRFCAFFEISKSSKRLKFRLKFRDLNLDWKLSTGDSLTLRPKENSKGLFP